MSGVYERGITYAVVKFWETGFFDVLIGRSSDIEYKAALMGGEVVDTATSEDLARGKAKFLNMKGRKVG